jgi:hypothetical protein
MAHQYTDSVQLGVFIKQVSDEGMAKGVSAKALILKAYPLHSLLHLDIVTSDYAHSHLASFLQTDKWQDGTCQSILFM